MATKELRPSRSKGQEAGVHREPPLHAAPQRQPLSPVGHREGEAAREAREQASAQQERAAEVPQDLLQVAPRRDSSPKQPVQAAVQLPTTPSRKADLAPLAVEQHTKGYKTTKWLRHFMRPKADITEPTDRLAQHHADLLGVLTDDTTNSQRGDRSAINHPAILLEAPFGELVLQDGLRHEHRPNGHRREKSSRPAPPTCGRP